MRDVILLMAFVCAPALADNWTPPEDPNPQAILQEAQADARAHHYEIALAKHVWFHENALSIDDALSGVRLSFALDAWQKLAKKYPPALTKLKEVRDQAANNVSEGKYVREAFLEMRSINKVLREQSRTKDVFEALDEEHPETAVQVFHLAQPSLVQSKAYALIGKYLMPNEDLAEMTEAYRRGKKMADDPRFGPRHLNYVNKKFSNDAMTLVAILAVNARTSEAEDIAASARAEWDDASFHAGLDKAIKGVVPHPWP